MSSSLHRHRYVSWCEDSAGPPTPVTTAPASPRVPHLNHQPAGSGSIPLLLLTPPETRRGETKSTFPQPTLTKTPHHGAVTQSPHTAPDSHDEGEDEGGEDRSLVLPRSSPVVSTRHRLVSWHGGGSGPSDPSSLDRPSPASGSLPLAQRLTVTSVEDLGSRLSSCPSSSWLQEDSSNLSLHLPLSGEQGLAEEHRGRGLPSCDAPPSSDLCTSVSEDRGCSGYPEFSAGIFKSSCELEKENAHFIVVDMLLEVLEEVKWTLMDTQRHSEDEPPPEQRQACKTCTHTQTCSDQQDKHTHSDEDVKRPQGNTHSSAHTHQHTQDKEEEEAGYDEDEHPTKTLSVLSTDSGFEDSGGDATSTPSAEQLAQQLVLQFRSRWLPSLRPRRGRRSLRSSLQELPGGVTVSSSLAEEIRLRTRMRGSLSWAPPRFQIIFTVQPAHRRSEAVALQHFLCAGCGTEVEPKYIRKLRYCEYLGRYFCDCCHSGSEAVIPGRLLSCWDFGRYPVSDFSKQLLDSVWRQPLFDLTCVGKTLYSRVKELDKFRELQDQLLCIKKLLTVCRLSEGVKAELEQLPAHLLEQPHLFSMEDLLRVKRGQLVAQAKAVLHSAVHHVENCELCLARGFICELCREGGVLFPFQSDVCSRCTVCRTCFHKHCFVEKKCPKCSRIQSRKNIQMDP